MKSIFLRECFINSFKNDFMSRFGKVQICDEIKQCETFILLVFIRGCIHQLKKTKQNIKTKHSPGPPDMFFNVFLKIHWFSVFLRKAKKVLYTNKQQHNSSSWAAKSIFGRSNSYHLWSRKNKITTTTTKEINKKQDQLPAALALRLYITQTAFDIQNTRYVRNLLSKNCEKVQYRFNW